MKADEIRRICEQYKIKNYTVHADGTVDVDGDVDFYNKSLDKLPLKFGKVSGCFDCRMNKLTSLEGCPSSVGGDFYYNSNDLTSLEGCPSYVGGDFYCYGNKLTSLEGCPSYVGGDFDCNSNDLTSLEFSPSSVGDYFDCRMNKLTSLEGCPTTSNFYQFYGNKDLTLDEEARFIIDNNLDCKQFIDYRYDMEDLVIAIRRVKLNSILN